MIFINAFFGLSFGVFLLLKALEDITVAETSILSSFGPVLILPFVWYKTQKSPPKWAWIGAFLVVICSIMLVEF